MQHTALLRHAELVYHCPRHPPHRRRHEFTVSRGPEGRVEFLEASREAMSFWVHFTDPVDSLEPRCVVANVGFMIEGWLDVKAMEKLDDGKVRGLPGPARGLPGGMAWVPGGERPLVAHPRRSGPSRACPGRASCSTSPRLPSACSSSTTAWWRGRAGAWWHMGRRPSRSTCAPSSARGRAPLTPTSVSPSRRAST